MQYVTLQTFYSAEFCVIRLSVAQKFFRMGGIFVSIVLSVFFDMLFNNAVARGFFRIRANGALILKKFRAIRQIVHLDYIFIISCKTYRFKRLPDITFVGFQSY